MPIVILLNADMYVNEGSPGSYYGSAVTLRTDASPDIHSYLRFTVQGLAGVPIVRARLLVYTNTTSSLGIEARSVADNGWDEYSTNYGNTPAMGEVLATSGAIAAGSWVEMDVTGYVTGDGVYSFGITTLSKSALSFFSRESELFAPQLILHLP